MSFVFRLSLLVFIALFVGSCGKKGLTLKIGDQDILALGSVDSCNFVQSSQGLRVSWKSSTPVTFIIGPSVPPEYDDAIQTAATVWNGYINVQLINVRRDDTFPNGPGDDGHNVIYWETDWPDDSAQEQARTSIHWDVSKLRDADIKINAKHYQLFKPGDTDTTGKISFLSIMIHEMGHGLGLKHINDSSSVMQPYLASGVSRDTPGQIDIDSMGCEY